MKLVFVVEDRGDSSVGISEYIETITVESDLFDRMSNAERADMEKEFCEKFGAMFIDGYGDCYTEKQWDDILRAESIADAFDEDEDDYIDPAGGTGPNSHI